MAAVDYGVGTAANVSATGIIGIFQKIKRHVRYVIVYKKNLMSFKEKMELLTAKRESVRQEVDAARRNLETILADVQLWCERVDKTIDDETKEVKDLEDRAKAKCFLGLCPNIKSRYQLSTKAEEYVADVDQLLQQGQFNDVAVRDVPVSSNIAAPKNYEAFDSRKEIFDQVVEALEDPTISMIGVYGPGGVGKTTLVKEVAGQVQKANLFCPVVLVTVTPTPDIEKIQRDIAELLGLKLEEKNIDTRASLLWTRLEKEKHILIVVDNIWGELNLEEVGIRFGDQHKGCKILLTSRNRDVLRNRMGAETFPINDLEEEEAWDLFKKMAENDFENSDLLPVATEVAKKCAGLPLAIVTVARALKNNDLSAWREALRQLHRPSPVNDIPAPVYSAIRLSFDNLKFEELKRTFLLCCLLVHNSHIEELLRFAMGLHLFEGVNTVEETRNAVRRRVSNLKDSCLLLDDYKNDSIVMHDFTRDVAIVIAREKDIFVLRDGDVFEEWPDEEKMQNFKMICLSFACIQNLPHELECPQLTLFSMGTSKWNSYWEMPPSFFEKMKKIEVLNLIQADFLSSASASSISFPTSLRTLCLKGCRLGDIVSLGKLKNLEILSLSESNIERLPEETRQLTKLRSLDLTGCRRLKIIPPGVLSSLSRLEELLMGGFGVIVGWNQEGNARLYELKELLLSRLTTLEICILDGETVKENLLFEKLQRYKIVIGVPWEWYDNFENPRTIKLRVNRSIDHLDDGYKGLLKKTEALYLEDLKGVEIVLNQVSNRASTSVCQHDELPLFGEEMELPFLEDLNLCKINAVGRIWHNQFLTLKSLTTLKIRHCDNLKGILSSSTAKSLAQLKSFSIIGCERLREVIFSEDIEEEDDNVVAISFPQLTTLSLEYLEHFIGFCSENYNIIFPSLKTVTIRDCPELKEFIYKSTGEKNTVLSVQTLFDEKISRMTRHGQVQANVFSKLEDFSDTSRVLLPSSISFENLTTLEISGCHGIVNLIACSTAKSLVQLTEMSINDCEMIEEIITGEGDEVEGDIIFARLKHLKLSYLPSLASFCLGKHNFGFPALEKVSVIRCPYMKIFSHGDLSTPILQRVQYIEYEDGDEDGVQYIEQYIEYEDGDEDRVQYIEYEDGDEDEGCWEGNLNATIKWLFEEKVGLREIKQLSLSDSSKWIEIWRNHEGILCFKSLTFLNVQDCSTLSCLFTVSIALELPQLLELQVSICTMMEHVILDEGPDEEVENKIVFPRLKTIRLECCADLASFYQGSKILKCPSLGTLEVNDCPKMFAFASTLSRETIAEGGNTSSRLCNDAAFFDNKVAFPQLEKLSLTNLKSCQKIWHDQLVGDSFSKLNDLSVWNCERLLNVFPFNMSERLQNLKEFKVRSCNLLEEIFASQILDADELPAVATTSFVFPEVTALGFYGLPKLKSFYSKMHTTKWPSLKQMRLEGCDMVEIIFASESLSFGELTNQQPLFWVNEDTFPTLKVLNLGQIPRMAWHGQFRANVFSKLSVPKLECFSGPSIDLFSSSISFENFTTLDISKCHRILNLIACSTAKSLVQLTEMSISDCEMIEEIIAGEGNEMKGDIIFARLEHLKLSYLPSLASFCSGKHNFDFPALEKVSVIGCPNMKIFSQGDLSTLILQRVQYIEDEDEGCWEDNLNATIKWLFEKKIGFRKIKQLSLSDSSKWIEIWRNPERILCFRSLASLQVHDCNTLRCLFTVSIALDLPQLSQLKVSNSTMMEHVILDEGPDEEVENKIVFPKLDYISLECCADLASFYQGSKILKCPSLKTLYVTDCPKMFAFASTLSRETIDDGGNTSSRLCSDAAFFDNKVEFPQLKGLMINRLGNCKKIWHDHLIDDSFSNLIILWVRNCDKLRNVFSLNMSHRLQKLMEFKVGKCDSLEEIFEPQVLNPGELHTMTATESIVFARLEYLHLSYLPSLASFCSEDHNFEFPTLEKMIVRKCPKMNVFCQGDLSAPELQKVSLTKEEEIWRWEGNLKATIQRLSEEMNVQNAEDDDEGEDENMSPRNFEWKMFWM